MDSTELIAAWNERKEILKEKDFRNDQWRLAFNAFLEGYSVGICDHKEQMMKEAVEGYVDFDFIDRDGRSHVIVKSYVVEDNYGIVTGGKCKCLILKDDEDDKRTN